MAGRADAPPRDALHSEALVDHQREYRRQWMADPLKLAIERFGLGDGAGEPVEDIAASSPLQSAGHDLDGHVVGDQLPRVHVLLGNLPQLASRVHVPPEDVARRDVLDVMRRGQTLRLGPLPRARRAQQDEPH